MELLATSVEELQPYLNVYGSFDFNELRPFIDIAQRYVKEAIGPEMYAELMASYQASIADDGAVVMTDSMRALWELAVSAIAHLTMFEGNDSFNIALTTGGATRMENNHLKSAYQYQVIAYKADRKAHGFQALDDLMEFLDSNEETYTTYKESETRDAYKSQWIQDVKTFEKTRGISGSRWIFLKLRSFMNHIVNTRIKAAIGDTRFTAIKAELLTGLSEENAALMDEYVRPAIAHLAFADAIIDLAMKVSDRGVTIYNTEGARGEIELYKEAPENFMFGLRKEEIRKGEYYLQGLEQRAKVLDGGEEVTASTEANLYADATDPGFATF